MNMDWALLSKRLIALSALGGTIDHFSGHRYLHFQTACGGYFDANDLSKSSGVPLPRSKRYDGIESILDDVDEFLAKAGHSTLVEVYDTYNGMMEGEAEGDDPLIALKVSP